jgi:hypothetical protein
MISNFWSIVDIAFFAHFGGGSNEKVGFVFSSVACFHFLEAFFRVEPKFRTDMVYASVLGLSGTNVEGIGVVLAMNVEGIGVV